MKKRRNKGYGAGFFRHERKQRWSLTVVFSLIVLAILLAAIALAAGAVYVLVSLGALDRDGEDIGMLSVILLMAGISLVLGWVIVFFSSRLPLKPINELINKMNRLASGDFRARLKFGSALEKHSAFNEIETSFNRMAQELENTEMLRSDFINNFSHEFKTPIVSIAGLAKLLRRGNLTEEQRLQYLQSIEEASMRLSDMATNVLNLTKVENQNILTDLSTFNLSEQLRSAVLLLEGKWTKKQIDWRIDLEEYEITANAELLRQVWLNLVENAIKFSPVGGRVELEIASTGAQFAVTVRNEGAPIPPDARERIFQKFYQADESHSAEGNGIGLAIVKRIVDLHDGRIEVTSEDGFNSFTVCLPRQGKNTKN